MYRSVRSLILSGAGIPEMMRFLFTLMAQLLSFRRHTPRQTVPFTTADQWTTHALQYTYVRHVYRTSCGTLIMLSLAILFFHATASAHASPHPLLKAGRMGNAFPAGQCTWWANERYQQLHGRFVPWRTQANAWQWAARAREAGWSVSYTPAVGSIVVLQPFVQGASGLGHVAIVEKLLDQGRFQTSNLNWGYYPHQVTSVRFSMRPGIVFVHHPFSRR